VVFAFDIVEFMTGAKELRVSKRSKKKGRFIDLTEGLRLCKSDQE